MAASAFKVVFVRHGESQWNVANIFTGWHDVDLSDNGVVEAVEAGRCLKEKGYKFDIVFTSVLRRAIRTAWTVCQNSENYAMPMISSWRLNERHYGGLQGMNKAETAAKHGDEQVKIWRRSFDVPPPPLEQTDPRHPCNDPLYANVPRGALPGAESLKLTIERVLPLWNDQIAPCVMAGKSVLVAAHGNSLRAICMFLKGMSETEVLEFNIPTAVPLVYELDANLGYVKDYYLMDEAEVAAKITAVANQAKGGGGGGGGASKPSAEALMLVEMLNAATPNSRDLTNDEETAMVLKLADQILASKIDIEQWKQMTYGGQDKKPASPVVISAVGAAESKLKLGECPPHHLTCMWAMYGEKNRIRTKAEHQNGQNFMVNKIKQLEWLFGGSTTKTFDVVAVDDGCPDQSGDLAKEVIAKYDLKNVTLLDVRDAFKNQDQFFLDRGLDEAAKKSRKGGAILYGLREVAKQAAVEGRPNLVMYTDSDLSTDMALCGLLSYGILKANCSISAGARYGSDGTFLVKPPDHGAAPHPQSHFEQPNMMKIVLRHYVRVRLLPMLQGIYDTQCAFKCFRREDLLAITEDVRSLQADFDMELLLCSLLHYRKQGVEQRKLAHVCGTLFTEDFAESNFMATADDPDKPYKTYATMTQGLVSTHERFIDQESEEAKNVKDLVEFCRGMDWQKYKKMHDKLNERGDTLFDHPFTLQELKAAAE